MIKKIQLFAIQLLIIFAFSAAYGQGEMPNNKPKPAPAPSKAPPKISGPGIPVYIPRARVYVPPTPQQNPVPAQKPVSSEQKMAAARSYTRSLINKLEPEVMEVEIAEGHHAFTVEGSKGFHIDFPEYAFVDNEGNVVTGEIKVELTEYTTNADFAGAGLTCQTTEGFMLETGGMINLNVLSGSEKVRLASGKSIEIRIDSVKKGDGFREFYGAGNGQGQTNWSLNPPPQTKAAHDTSTLNGYTIVMANTKQRVKGEGISFISFSSAEPLSDYVNKQLKVSKETKSLIKKSGIPFEYIVELNSAGKVKEVKTASPEVAVNSLIAPLHNEIVKILKDAPALAMDQGNLYANTPYTLLFVTTGSSNSNIRIRKPVEMDSMGNRIAPEPEIPTEKKVSEDFSMNAKGLNYINCDRFATNTAPRDTVAFNFSNADAFVYVIFKDIRSLMMPQGKNGKYVLRNVPEGQNVRYVAVVFNDKGEVKLGSVDTQISNSRIDFNNLVKYDEAGFRELLNVKAQK